MNTKIRFPVPFWIVLIVLVITIVVLFVSGVNTNRPYGDDFVNGAMLLTGVLIGQLSTIVIATLNAPLDREHQLRMAALEKRLEVHQEAYKWLRMLQNSRVETSDLYKEEARIRVECQEWLDSHCLYFDPLALEAFEDALFDHDTLISIARPQNQDEVKMRREALHGYRNAYKELKRAVFLPPIAPETEPLQPTEGKA